MTQRALACGAVVFAGSCVASRLLSCAKRSDAASSRWQPMKTLVRALSLALSILMGACASVNATGPLFDRHIERREGYGTLVLFRPPLFVGSAWFPTVRINQSPAAKLVNGGYTSIALQPGRYHISGNGQFDDLYEADIEIKANHTTFAEFRFDLQGIGEVTPIAGAFVPSASAQIKRIRWVVTEEDATLPALPPHLAECRYFDPILAAL